VLLLENEDILETLLIQRTERHDDPWSGQIGLPGGKIKASDGSVRAALVREVEEEVGVDLGASGEELGPLSTGNPMRRLELKVQPWVYGLHARPTVSIGPEVSSAFWVSLPELATNRTRGEISIRGEKWTVECFKVKEKIVWGYTYRVLTELLTLPGVLTAR
jgi:8-oxo-dGTP pyrophosphatase MutT (NUDIX family)